MEEKRKGYKTKEGQKKANERYLENNPEAKEKKKINSMRSNAKRFIKEFATPQELEELENLIKNKNLGGMKMTRLEERAIKGLEFIKEAGDYLVELESYEVSKLDGECMIDTWNCGYINKEDLEKLKEFVENETEVLKGDFPKKVNVVIENNDSYEWVDVFYPKQN